MKTIQEYCLFLLKSERLEDKLTPIPENLIDDRIGNYNIPEKPGREKRLAFSDRKQKIPRLEHLNLQQNRALTLHHFANHELMAIELFSLFILKFPELDEKIKLDTLKTIRDEQSHLSLYISRMEELGIQFGDRPLNYIFWKYLPLMKTPETFSAILSVAFEGANLDYSQIYKHTFEEFGDIKTAKIMDTIYRDELKHVRRGVNVLHRKKPDSVTDWEYFTGLISYPFTPRRAKGYIYFPESRLKCGLDLEFSEELGKYRDEFSNRKPEQIPSKILEKL